MNTPQCYVIRTLALFRNQELGINRNITEICTNSITVIKIRLCGCFGNICWCFGNMCVCFGNYVGVFVICVLLFTVICIICTAFLLFLLYIFILICFVSIT